MGEKQTCREERDKKGATGAHVCRRHTHVTELCTGAPGERPNVCLLDRDYDLDNSLFEVL